jgi:hypothetical protein
MSNSIDLWEVANNLVSGNIFFREFRGRLFYFLFLKPIKNSNGAIWFQVYSLQTHKYLIMSPEYLNTMTIYA